MCILLVIVVFFLSGCTPPLTGEAVREQENQSEREQRGEKFTLPDPPDGEKQERVKQNCTAQIHELETQKEEKAYDLLQVEGDKRKLTLELQFKKQNQKYEDELDNILENVKVLNDESSALKSSIDALKSAIRILKEKCPQKG